MKFNKVLLKKSEMTGHHYTTYKVINLLRHLESFNAHQTL